MYTYHKYISILKLSG